MLMNTFRPFGDWPVEKEHNQKSGVRWHWKSSHDLVPLLGTSLHPQPGHFAKCEEVESMHQLYKDDMKPFRMPVHSTGIDLLDLQPQKYTSQRDPLNFASKKDVMQHIQFDWVKWDLHSWFTILRLLLLRLIIRFRNLTSRAAVLRFS